jgi:hypothetical protein
MRLKKLLTGQLTKINSSDKDKNTRFDENEDSECP